MDSISLDTLSFGDPRYLWLLAAPALLCVLWLWQLFKRRSDTRRLKRSRVLPVRERFSFFGDLIFWLGIIAATSLCIVALAQPRARIAVVNKAGADIIVLQDASASMYVSDVQPDRWRRSLMFLRAFAERMSWKGDRMALALFAHRASPQLRLTKDPNALFFFLDHLRERSPFALENDTTWDTNIEEGVYWGLKLLNKDEELFGRNKNAKAFVVISDGQAWSGEVRKAVEETRARRIPIYVVGVGTAAGGMIPEPAAFEGDAPPPKIRSVLDRESLREIARTSGGDYFEIGQLPDEETAFRIIRSVRNRAAAIQQETSYEDLYWRFLVAAAVLVGLSILFLRRGAQLWWQLAGTSAALAILLTVVR